jgi:hypothetical protein
MSNINYVRIYEDGHTEATDVAPSFGMYEATKANDDRDVKIDGLWYPASNGGELVVNGTFDVDLSGWTVGNGTPTHSINSLKCDTSDSVTDRVYQDIITTIGVTYKVTFKVSGGVNPFNIDVYIDNNGVFDYKYSYNRANTIQISADGTYAYTFTAESTLTKIYFSNQTGPVNQTIYFDNISVFKTQPTLGTVYSPQPTYLNNNGKLVGFEIANGDVVDLHYDIDYPKIVEDVIQVDTMIADEYKGKNACTAWVNFDGTTTPPTIRDSYNVSSVVRTATGKFEIYFEEPMDNANYTCVYGGGAFSNANAVVYGRLNNTPNELNKTTYYNYSNADYNTPNADILILGGKN